MRIKIQRLNPEAKLPQYAHPGDSGADLVAVTECTIQPMQWLAVPTGIAAEVPPGFELQVRPRSGWALKQGVTVLNSPGTVDAGYRGEIKVILLNLGSEAVAIARGQKIAQMVVAPVVWGQFEEVDHLTPSQRGSGGFGSTGLTSVEDDMGNPQS
ncbi:deoxyuridine 5'-triphosphate nucleotidohydrolase [Neosynechococcus sphagnicola sy1]|uniref:Deoxyuridine 5'-triphosphate nucleotidohydrolase n=1 Tax=Neosynechococcus sphagnicola sy1 TaxID=1497020 RepID=A0A098TKI0_9CYAN|nr:deoxyuridine 5'-triphosphate nucleotidohydrolase [Neosynechococcus sphagnicola sy1]